ncbi:MAG TPA: hypothetical protein VF828_04125 [Patescibacteria group bacterium]
MSRKMKVFFSASVRGNKEANRRIYFLIKKLGFQTTSKAWETDFPERYYLMSDKERNQHVENVYKHLDEAEIAVLETTLPSFSIGQFIQYALDHRIPVLTMYKKNSPLGTLPGLEKLSDKILVQEYNDQNVEKVLREGINYLKENSETRFTLILPTKIIKYLDKIAKKGMTRSEYIRKLIEGEMENKG